MLVHAHPDDETINDGVTMARYVAEGAAVTLVTCTLGEEGEVLIDDLAHLAAEHTDDLGPHRLSELHDAMRILGVTDYVRLGGDGHFRDSGMAWHPDGFATARDVLRPGIFWTADLLEASSLLVELIRDRRPHVLITYNEVGNYGHPDHIQAHRVAMYATQLAAIPYFRPDLGEAWQVSRVLWTIRSRTKSREQAEKLSAAGMKSRWGDTDDSQIPFLADDVDIAVAIDGPEWVDRKLDAMRAHATQITADGPFFSDLDVLGKERWQTEWYELAAGEPYPADGGWADDLFAGLS